LSEISKSSKDSENAIKSFLKKKLLKKAERLKGKFAPISEVREESIKILSVQKVYSLQKQIKDFYFFIVKNYIKQPKNRFFLVLSLASQSSDFLVSLARDFAKENDVKLIQYSIFPKSFRVNLLSLKEIKNINEYLESIELLKNFRQHFKKKVLEIKNLTENK